MLDQGGSATDPEIDLYCHTSGNGANSNSNLAMTGKWVGERQYPTSRGGWSTEKMYIFYHSGSRETGDEGWYEGIMPNEDIPSPKLRSMHLTTSIESDKEGGRRRRRRRRSTGLLVCGLNHTAKWTV